MKKSKTNISIVDSVGGRVKPSIILGKSSLYQSGDLLDANAVAEIVASGTAAIDLSGLLTKEYANTTYATKDDLDAELEDIKSYISDRISIEIAKIIAGADESFDTLKEVADWISSHLIEATQTANQVTTNTDDISNLRNVVNNLDNNVSDSIVWSNA